MPTAKDEVLEILRHIRDDVSLDDIQHQIYLWQKVRQGLEAEEKGDIVPQNDVRARLAKWLEK